MARPKQQPKAVKQETTNTDTNETEEVVQINKWDGSAVKNNLDDSVRKLVLEELPKYQERHARTDARLAISFLACAFAGFACLYGWLVPHPESSFVVGCCVAMYFIITTFTSIQDIYAGNHLVLEAADGDNLMSVSTHLTRYGVHYSVEIKFSQANNPKPLSATFSRLISDFFYENGIMCEAPLRAAVKELIATAKSKEA